MRHIALKNTHPPSDIFIFSGNIQRNFIKILKEFNLPGKALVVSNPTVYRFYGKQIKNHLSSLNKRVYFQIVPDTEKAKTLRYFQVIMKKAVEVDRLGDLFFVSLGGGVMGDLVGFASSVYRRGTPYIQIPTTLLAQVDSSLGGKTALDLPFAKNMVGTFWQPRVVISCVDFLNTLPFATFAEAFSEVVKYGVIKDRNLFILLEGQSNPHALRKKKSIIEEIVWRCAYIKSQIVNKDEKEEKGLRTILNFGHTVGHALEAATSFSGYSHAQAVAIGMAVATSISVDMGLCKSSLLERLEGLLGKFDLPCYIKKRVSLFKIMECLLRDKKFKSGKIKMVLPLDVGRVRVIEEVPLSLIRKSIRRRII